MSDGHGARAYRYVDPAPFREAAAPRVALVGWSVVRVEAWAQDHGRDAGSVVVVRDVGAVRRLPGDVASFRVVDWPEGRVERAKLREAVDRLRARGLVEEV